MVVSHLSAPSTAYKGKLRTPGARHETPRPPKRTGGRLFRTTRLTLSGLRTRTARTCCVTASEPSLIGTDARRLQRRLGSARDTSFKGLRCDSLNDVSHDSTSPYSGGYHDHAPIYVLDRQ